MLKERLLLKSLFGLHLTKIMLYIGKRAESSSNSGKALYQTELFELPMKETFPIF